MQPKYEVRSYSDTKAVSKAISDFLVEKSEEAIKKHKVFRIALSGGSLCNTLAISLTAPEYRDKIDWSKWKVFYADERCVPLNHEDSNYLLSAKELLDKVPVPKNQIFTINPKLVNKPSDAAEDYQRVILAQFTAREEVMAPNFDVLFLGIGSDGHTCSLFPNHALLEEKTLWVAYIEDSPKPPLKRITLTLPVLNHAVNAVFVVTGGSKKDALKSILEDPKSSLPAKHVRPIKGDCYWFLDKEATEGLDKSKIKEF